LADGKRRKRTAFEAFGMAAFTDMALKESQKILRLPPEASEPIKPNKKLQGSPVSQRSYRNKGKPTNTSLVGDARMNSS